MSLADSATKGVGLVVLGFVGERAAAVAEAADVVLLPQEDGWLRTRWISASACCRTPMRA